MGAVFKVGNGNKILFWEDVWIQDKPLYQIFPRPYACCRDKSILVGDCWVDGEWDIKFRRAFGREELSEWEALLVILGGVHLSHPMFKISAAMALSGWILQQLKML